MIRAVKQCASCPFRGLSATERRELARVPAEEWACHTEQGYWASSDIQCRGHWEAQRKFPESVPDYANAMLSAPLPSPSQPVGGG